MTTKRTRSSSSSNSSNTLLNLAILVNFLAIGLIFYLISTFQKRLDNIEADKLNLSSRITEVAAKYGSNQANIKINAPISQKEINASTNKLIKKSNFELNRKMLCSKDSVDNIEFGEPAYNVIIFKDNKVYDYLVKKNSRITKKTASFGEGKYILNGFSLTATITFSNEPDVKIFHLQISGLSKKHKNVSEISLMPDKIWSTQSCLDQNITNHM